MDTTLASPYGMAALPGSYLKKRMASLNFPLMIYSIKIAI
jgi:hypothetical protein